MKKGMRIKNKADETRMKQKIAIISFTGNGRRLADRIADGLRREENHVTVDMKCAGAQNSVRGTLSEWTRIQFADQDALIFVGAAGIAVRAIAPYVKSKTEDPAVLVIDELGHYCIPLLSGHIGGANELAVRVSGWIQAQPVITTATDLHQKWAVDVFAVKNGLYIRDMQKAKAISAGLLAGCKIQIAIQGGTEAERPEEHINFENAGRGMIRLLADDHTEPDISIGIYQNPAWKKTLYLIPKAVVVGIGCRKGTSSRQIEAAVHQMLVRERIFPESVCQAASIDLKAKEAGILEYCRKYQLKFSVYSAKELQKEEGDFTASGFVEQTVGVDNVCERSAVCASNHGRLIARKHAGDGVTVALAEKEWRVHFE